MKQIHFTLFLIFVTACTKSSQHDSVKYTDLTELHPKEKLIRISTDSFYQYGSPCGYVNQEGDTVIPIGKYSHCFFNTIRTFGIVVKTGTKISDLIAIDQKENILYGVYWFEMGPDYIQDGLFRIIRNGKIGYADSIGRIIIEPKYSCATSFNNGKAKVTYDCNLVTEDDDDPHTRMVSDSWMVIDKADKEIHQ